jgi:hypothetical protein
MPSGAICIHAHGTPEVLRLERVEGGALALPSGLGTEAARDQAREATGRTRRPGTSSCWGKI